MTVMQQLSESQASPEIVINENFVSLEHHAVYGKNPDTTTGLTWGYLGGRWGGISVSAGTLSLTNATTNYIVVHRTTGAITVSTSSTNWNATTTYARVYKLTTAGSAVTATEDHRSGPNGVHGMADIAGGAIDASAVTYTPATDGDWDSSTDPGNVDDALDELASRMSTVESGTFQPLDSDLTTIAGLTATTDSFIQAKSSAWASRTPAQAAADLQGDGLTVDLAGFRGIPQNSQSANYTLVAADAGKHILHPSSDANARTFTIPANGSVAFPVGTAVTFVNQTSQVVSIAITTDTLTLANSTTTGTRSLAQNGVATAIKVASTSWVISGTGLT